MTTQTTSSTGNTEKLLHVLTQVNAGEHVEENKREDFLDSLAKEITLIYQTNLPDNGVDNDQGSRKLMETVDLLFNFGVGDAVDAQARSGYRKMVAIYIKNLYIKS